LATRTAELAARNRNVALARAGGVAVPVVFAAWDIMDAINDYRETTAANR
jgi:hypothetical protein